VHPRYRTPWLLPFLLTLLFLVVPAQANAGGFSAFGVPSGCPGVPAGDLGVTATDTTSPPTGWQSTDVVVSLTGTNVAGWQWMVDCGTPQSGGPGQTVTFNVSGSFRLSHRVQDGNGLWTDWTDDFIQVDKILPNNTSTSQPGWTNAPVDITVKGSDTTSAIDHVEWNLDGGGVQAGPSGTVLHITGDGTHTLDTQVFDLAGNFSVVRHDTVQIDTIAPLDATSTPSTWQYVPTTITVTGTDSGSGIGHVEWTLDGTPGSGPDGSGVVIPDGTHLLRTRIIDLAGNASGWTDHTVQVDTTGPQDQTSVPGPWQPTSPVDITVTGVDPQGSGIDHVNWELDGVSGTGPNNSVVHVSGDGVHELKTQVVDGGAEASGWNTRYVRIDTVTPTDATVTSNGWFRTAQTVPVTGVDAHSGVQKVEWKLDSGSTQTSTGNPANVLISGDGNHTLITRVYDNAGHVSGYKTNYLQIDGSAPNNTTPAADSAWRKTQYSVVLSGTDSVSGMSKMLYTVDGGPVQQGPSGILTAVVSGAGTHTLRTYAEDVAGNQSGFRDETIRIDNVPPTDTTTAPGTPVQNNYPVTLGGTDAHSGINIIKYTIDGGAVQSGAAGSTVSISGDGPHTLQTMAIDNAGNDSGWKSQTVTVDLSLTADSTPPTDTTTVSAGWKTTDYTLTLHATDGSGVGVDYMEYRLDGGNIQQAPEGSTVLVTDDGVHDLETRAYDLLGNVSAWKPQTISLDKTVPVDTSDITVAPAWSTSRAFVLSGTDATSGVASISYQVDGGSIQTVSNGGTVTLPSDGNHTIRHRVNDVAGQASGWVLSSVRIDSVAPANTSAAAPTAWQTASGISLPLTGTDALSGVDHYEWRVDGGTVHTGSPAVVTTDGVQLLETRVLDKAGNDSGWRQETVKIDRTAPTNVTAVPASGWQNTNFSTIVAGTDATSGVAGVEWKVDGGTVSTTTSVSIATTGAHTLSTRIRDTAGNWSAWRDDPVGIDKVVPTLTVGCGSAEWRSTPATCSVAADGGVSGLALVTGTRGSGSPDAVSGGTYVVDADGAWSLSFRAVDGAGNEKLALAQVKIDRTAPAAAVSCTPGAGTSWVCTASGSDAMSGVAGLTWSVNGSPGVAISNGATFAVQKGVVTVSATDRAGNAGTSPAVTLADRTPPPAPATPTKPPKTGITARERSEAVLRKGKGTTGQRALGQLEISALPAKTSVTLRPLALGPGRYKVVLKLTADRKSKTVTKTVKSKAGYSPQVVIKLGGAAEVLVKLTVSHKSGKRWKTYATGRVKL
jgi:hypothetical protein